MWKFNAALRPREAKNRLVELRVAVFVLGLHSGKCEAINREVATSTHVPVRRHKPKSRLSVLHSPTPCLGKPRKNLKRSLVLERSLKKICGPYKVYF